MRLQQFSRTLFLVLFGIFLLTLVSLHAGRLLATESPSVTEQEISEQSADELLDLGKNLYRYGKLISGEPSKAIVQGDIPVSGTMFTCVSCHLRNGIGTVEGSLIMPDINSKSLFRDLQRGERRLRIPWENLEPSVQRTFVRPAYTDETLARVIRTGIDAANMPLNPVMPRYDLDDKNMAVLIYYLKSLCRVLPEGVDEKTLRFATVITDDVSPEVRTAMVDTLKAYINSRNAQPRQTALRAEKGYLFHKEFNEAFRTIELDVWLLKGKPENWTKQLEEYYTNRPVFALLGGISDQSWQPIHAFCERRELPCLLPMTPFPVISDTDWYTLYFSRGYYQEGENAARYVSLKLGPDNKAKVILFCDGSEAAKSAKEGFLKIWNFKQLERPVSIDNARVLDSKSIESLLKKEKPAYCVAFSEIETFSKISTSIEQFNSKIPILGAGSMLEGSFDKIPVNIREILHLTWPYNLPDEEKRMQLMSSRWLEVRDVDFTNPRVQSNMYFVGWSLSMIFKAMLSDFYRDYFFDLVDRSVEQTYTIATYPRLSFGPGQRYASKGCYIVTLTEDEEPQITKETDWIIH